MSNDSDRISSWIDAYNHELQRHIDHADFLNEKADKKAFNYLIVMVIRFVFQFASSTLSITNHISNNKHSNTIKKCYNYNHNR